MATPASGAASLPASAGPTIRWSGAAAFARLTARHVGQKLALVVDGEVRSAPEIRTAITEGRALISGMATRLEAHPLADILRIGALPFPLSLEHVAPTP